MLREVIFIDIINTITSGNCNLLLRYGIYAYTIFNESLDYYPFCFLVLVLVYYGSRSAYGPGSVSGFYRVSFIGCSCIRLLLKHNLCILLVFEK